MRAPMTRFQRLLPVLLLLVSSAAHAEDAFKSGVFDPPRMAPAFTLQGSDGAPLSLEKFRGKVVVLGFGYTHCEAVCPITLANLARVERSLGAAAKDVQVVYVTVDPERDSVARLHEFLSHFDARFVGATDSPAALERVRQAYGIVASKLPAPPDHPQDYAVHHSSFIYLIDRAGKLRALVPFGKAPDDIVHDLRILLAEK